MGAIRTPTVWWAQRPRVFEKEECLNQVTALEQLILKVSNWAARSGFDESGDIFPSEATPILALVEICRKQNKVLQTLLVDAFVQKAVWPHDFVAEALCEIEILASQVPEDCDEAPTP